MKTSFLFASLLAWTCAGQAWPGHYDVDSAVEQQPAGPELVTAEWLKQHLNDPNQVVFHVAMDKLGYDAGHVPGAVFAALGEFHNHMAADRLPEPAAIAAALGRFGLSNASRVVLVGDPLSTSILFVALDYVGHGGKTAVLDGGLPAWRTAGGAVSKEAVSPKPVTFVPNVRTDMVVDAAWIKENLGSKRVALLDARTRAEFDGTANERLPRKGHIPGAKFVPWLATFDTRDVPRDASGAPVDVAPDAARLLPRVELERLLTDNGAQRDGLVVSYCTVGMRASHMYFVSRLLGYPARIYVGSMADWTRNADNPVVGLSKP
jgi:thiosulfate/3-mercaptopyruvate sulfurtransferase